MLEESVSEYGFCTKGDCRSNRCGSSQNERNASFGFALFGSLIVPMKDQILLSACAAENLCCQSKRCNFLDKINKYHLIVPKPMSLHYILETISYFYYCAFSCRYIWKELLASKKWCATASNELACAEIVKICAASKNNVSSFSSFRSFSVLLTRNLHRLLSPVPPW